MSALILPPGWENPIQYMAPLSIPTPAMRSRVLRRYKEPASGNGLLTNLNAYYPMEAGAPDRLDSHSNGYDLDVEGGTVVATTSSGGKDGEANDFDGTSYISRADAGDGEGFDDVTDFAVFAWIYLNTLNYRHTIACMFENITDGKGWCFIAHGQSDDNLRVYIAATASDAGSNYVTSTDGSLTTGAWFHVGFTFESGTVKLYQDGVELSTTPTGTIGSAIVDTATGTDLAFGEANGGNQWGLDGLIEEVAIYSGGVPSESQITTLAGGTYYDDFTS